MIRYSIDWSRGKSSIYDCIENKNFDLYDCMVKVLNYLEELKNMRKDSYRALIKKFLKWIDGFSLFDFFYSDLTSFELTELHSVAKEMDLKDYKYVRGIKKCHT